MIGLENKKIEINFRINNIKKLLGNKSELVVKNIFIGEKNYLKAAIIYLNGLANKDIINRDILNPLMLQIKEDLSNISNIDYYLSKRYIAVSNTYIEMDINKAADSVNKGKTVIVVEGSSKFIVVETTGGVYRGPSEPATDFSLRGPREGFIENLETNVSMLRRNIKDKNLKLENFTLGKRSKTTLALMYIDDIVDKDLLNTIKSKIEKIDVDSVLSTNIIEEIVEDNPLSVLPQTIGSERPDVITSKLMEGRVAFLLEGISYVTTYPTTFIEFFQTPEDYYGKTVQGFFMRIIRFLAAFIVITFPAIYITFIKFNSDLIPIEFIQSLIMARKGIALTPFMSLLSMQITIEFLREGGLRLPGKVGQTLSVVGGIIIGDAALKAKIVSSFTLLIAGISTVASFVISNYQMAISIRIIAYPILILSNWLGALGIVIGWYFILAYLCSLENLGVPYFSFHKSDMKDTFVRVPNYKMNKRPQSIPHNNDVRQGNIGGGDSE